MLERCRRSLRPKSSGSRSSPASETADPGRHFVHGDLGGNVYLSADRVPVILDVSPYLRPRRWAEAIVLVDAVLWHGAGQDLIGTFTSDKAGDLLRRALLFRLTAEALAAGHRVDVARYRRALTRLG